MNYLSNIKNIVSMNRSKLVKRCVFMYLDKNVFYLLRREVNIYELFVHEPHGKLVCTYNISLSEDRFPD